MAGQSNPFIPITFPAGLPLKVSIFTVNMQRPPTWLIQISIIMIINIISYALDFIRVVLGPYFGYQGSLFLSLQFPNSFGLSENRSYVRKCRCSLNEIGLDLDSIAVSLFSNSETAAATP